METSLGQAGASSRVRGLRGWGGVSGGLFSIQLPVLLFSDHVTRLGKGAGLPILLGGQRSDAPPLCQGTASQNPQTAGEAHTEMGADRTVRGGPRQRGRGAAGA